MKKRFILIAIVFALLLYLLTSCASHNDCPAYEGVRQHPYVAKE